MSGFEVKCQIKSRKDKNIDSKKNLKNIKKKKKRKKVKFLPPIQFHRLAHDPSQNYGYRLYYHRFHEIFF